MFQYVLFHSRGSKQPIRHYSLVGEFVKRRFQYKSFRFVRKGFAHKGFSLTLLL